MLYHVISQALGSKFLTGVIVATTVSKEDNIIAKFCKENSLECFRGSKLDVLDRYYQCAKKFHCDPVIRISADSPLIDPLIIDRVIRRFLKNSYDYVSNNVEKINGEWKHSTCNFPVGTVVEVASFNTLEKTWKNAKLLSEREHVFPYIHTHSNLFKISNVKNRINLDHIRTTVDKKKDLEFVTEIYKRMSSRKKLIFTKDILKFFLSH